MEWIGYGLAFAFGWYIMPVVLIAILTIAALVVSLFTQRR